MKKTIFILGLGGTLFAGYLSAVKLFGKTCAFGESCQTFLGYPACYFGFAMFALITLLAALSVWGKMGDKKAHKYISLVSFLGILFVGYFTAQELPLLFAKGLSAYFFGLPTCSLGLIFYILIFALSLKSFSAEEGQEIEE